MRNYDICIIGGGASGLAAAASLSSHFHTVLLEKNGILGRKIMATGGGRCNITNTACAHCDLTLDFFKSLGMELYHDTEGRYYPYSNQARDVARVLEEAALEKGTEVVLDCGVTKIQKKADHFQIFSGKRSFSAKKVILAVGGKAAPALGTTGDGYGLARSMGHETTTIYPILTGIECRRSAEDQRCASQGNGTPVHRRSAAGGRNGRNPVYGRRHFWYLCHESDYAYHSRKGSFGAGIPAALSSGTGSGAGFLRKRAAAQEKLVRDFVLCSFSNSLIGGHKGVETSGARCEGLEKCTVHGRRDPSG